MAAPWQGLPVRLERAPHRGAAFALSNAFKRARIRSIGSRSRGSLLIFRLSPAVAPPGPSLPCRPRPRLARVNRSSWYPWPTLARREPTAAEIDGPVWSVSDRGTAGAFRSSRADGGPQVLPPARATVPPWLPAKSVRVSNLPACFALGPPASAAQYSCRREPCTGRSAWLPLGRACLSAWIEHRSGEQRSP